jgi:hypothetical protein
LQEIFISGFYVAVDWMFGGQQRACMKQCVI